MPDGSQPSGYLTNPLKHTMFYKLRPVILFRYYDGFGYLTDNSNFGYRLLGTPIVGDKVVSESAAIMLDCLGRHTMSSENMVHVLMGKFSGVDENTLKRDIEKLFQSLVSDGFMLSGINAEDCDRDTFLSNKTEELEQSVSQSGRKLS